MTGIAHTTVTTITPIAIRAMRRLSIE